MVRGRQGGQGGQGGQGRWVLGWESAGKREL